MRGGSGKLAGNNSEQADNQSNMIDVIIQADLFFHFCNSIIKKTAL
jgi:hypothetical protein